MPKLFTVYLGGNAPRANTELHDVVFVCGEAIEETYDALLAAWFGSPRGLHIDSWIELDVVDGYRISLAEAPRVCEDRLYFVNLGAYRRDEFTELHANRFLVARSAADAKLRAKREWRSPDVETVHKDNVAEVDACLELAMIGRLHVVLTHTGETSKLRPDNRYHPIPKPVVAAYVARMR
ncbi:MAG TPA: DUF1543 domain-containing protein [Polyangiaceae bacterium]|jgi:hypothetical protein|nr:DUF1543 domain-containing protein [Polyangiaceae bacterium]